MRKIHIILLIIIVSLIVFIPLLLNGLSINSESSDSLESDTYVITDGTLFSIDHDYAQRKESVKSNAELTNLNEEFAEIWKNKVDLYFQTILEFYRSKGNSEMIVKTQKMKDEWDKYYIAKMDYYEEFMFSIHKSGSIVPIKLSEYSRSLYRNKAIELYKLCLNLYDIDVEPLEIYKA